MPDAELEAPLGRQASVARPQLLLRLDRAQDGLDHARELGDQAVAPGVDHPAAVALDQPGQGVAVPLEGLQRADLVAIHQPAVALDVGAEDGRELALDGRRHASTPVWRLVDSEHLAQPAGDPTPCKLDRRTGVSKKESFCRRHVEGRAMAARGA